MQDNCKLKCKPNKYAIQTSPDFGPHFGHKDLVLFNNDQKLRPRASFFSELGNNYCNPNDAKYTLTHSEVFDVAEVEVFEVIFKWI